MDVSIKRQYIIPTIPGTSISYGAISSGGSTTVVTSNLLPIYVNSSLGFYWEASSNSIRTPYSFYADGEIAAFTSAPALADWRVGFLKEASLGPDFYWSGGYLEASGTGGGTGDVTKVYVDGSLGARDTAIGLKINNASIGISGGVLAYRTFGTAANSATTDFATAAQGTDARTPVSHNNTYHSETYITSAALSTYAPLASPTFTGTATTPVLSLPYGGSVWIGNIGDSSTRLRMHHASVTGSAYVDYYENLHFRTGPTSSGIYTMTCTSLGRIGIGTQVPTTLLHVEGTIRAIDVSLSGNVYAGGEITAYYSSDERLKYNIKSFTALGIIKKLQPKKFKWNEKAASLNPAKDDRNNYGLIAQEVEAILPEIVHPIYEEYKAVDYVQLISICIQGIKELNTRINTLEKDLNYYKNYDGKSDL